MDETKRIEKEALIKASNSVRDKFRALQNARVGAEFRNIEKFKPITGKLDTIIAGRRIIESPYTHYKTEKNEDISPRYVHTPPHIINPSDLLSPLPTIHHENITRKVLNREKRLGRKRQDHQRRIKKHRDQLYSNQRPLYESDVESFSSDPITSDEDSMIEISSDPNPSSVVNVSPKLKTSTRKKFPKGVRRLIKKYSAIRRSTIRGPKQSLLQKELQELDKEIKMKKLEASSKNHIDPSPSTSQLIAEPVTYATITSVDTTGTSTQKPVHSKRIPFRASEKREAKVQLTSAKDKKKKAESIQKSDANDTILISSGESSTPSSPTYDTTGDDSSDGETMSKQRVKKKRGSGLFSPELMRHNRNEHVSYTYWDDPNELVERLRLLMASQAAGHTGHTNEIASIVEELREACLID